MSHLTKEQTDSLVNAAKHCAQARHKATTATEKAERAMDAAAEAHMSAEAAHAAAHQAILDLAAVLQDADPEIAAWAERLARDHHQGQK